MVDPMEQCKVRISRSMMVFRFNLKDTSRMCLRLIILVISFLEALRLWMVINFEFLLIIGWG